MSLRGSEATEAIPSHYVTIICNDMFYRLSYKSFHSGLIPIINSIFLAPELYFSITFFARYDSRDTRYYSFYPKAFFIFSKIPFSPNVSKSSPFDFAYSNNIFFCFSFIFLGTSTLILIY